MPPERATDLRPSRRVRPLTRAWRALLLALALGSLLAACTATPTTTTPTPTASAGFPPVPPRTRGAYVTGSSTPDQEELAWLGRFRVVHAGGLLDPLPQTAIAALRQAGVATLLVYDWLPATYHYTDGETDDAFTQWVYTHRQEATLNPHGPFPHCTAEGYDWCEDYYFDLGNPTVRQKRVAYLVHEVRALGYDGVFFDWGNSLFLDEPDYAALRATYMAKHPDLPYAQAIALFVQALRDAGLMVQTNQGYRDAATLLPHLDYDTSESAGTTDMALGREVKVGGQGLIAVPDTVYYPNGADPRQGSLEDTLAVWHDMQRQVERFAGPHFHGIVHLNYAAPRWVFQGPASGYLPQAPRNAIFYNYALARLFDQVTYTEVPWDHTLERDEVYFYDLGEPVEDTYRPLAQGGYVRYYTQGLVLVGAWPSTVTLTLRHPSLPARGMVYDAYTHTTIPLETPHHLQLTVKPEQDPVTGQAAPAGRVVLYIPQAAGSGTGQP